MIFKTKALNIALPPLPHSLLRQKGDYIVWFIKSKVRKFYTKSERLYRIAFP